MNYGKLEIYILNDDVDISQALSLLAKKGTKTCCVLLENSFEDLSSKVRTGGGDKIFYIDSLSSHYMKRKNTANCVFIDKPNTERILKAIQSRIEKQEICNLVVDNISAFLYYQEAIEVQQFTNCLKEGPYSKANKIFFIKTEKSREADLSNFIEDLKLFADQVQVLETVSQLIS